MKSLPFVKKAISSIVLVTIVAAAALVATAQNPPLSLADLLIGLRSKKVTIEERNQILSTAIMERGVTFINSPEIEKELTATGADARLIAAVRAKSLKPAPTPTPVPVATPTPADFYQKRADASLAKGEVDAALSDYDKALEMKANDPNLYVSRGKAHFSKKDFDKSVKDYDKAIQLAPKTAVAFLNRGASYEKLGDVEKALSDYKEAVNIEPNSDLAKAEVKRIEGQIAKDAAEKEAARLKAEAAAKAAEVVPEFLNLGNLSAVNAERMVTPTYPPIARQTRITGKVNVEVDLDEEGNVTAADATSGHAMLRQAAEDAAKRSKFKPASYNGKPIKAKGVITYSFSL